MNRGSRPRAIMGGYAIAVAGVAGFIVAVGIGAGFGINGPAATFLAMGSFTSMFIALVAGTTVVAHGKGYPLALGLLVGLVAPLGLLIVAFLPDRR
jgi:hypothetical protein